MESFMAKNKLKKSSPELTPEQKTFNSATANWFPGHMLKAMGKIKENAQKVDIVVEIRDARAPLVTSNKEFTDTIDEKPRLVVFNKANLADKDITELWKEWLDKKSEKYIFINALNKKSVSEVIKSAINLIKNQPNKKTADLVLQSKLKMMIIGIPNTGKSTIINTLSNRNASKVADRPGQTQKELWVKANDELNILDTPGVMPPTINTKDQALKLSALNAISERIMDAEDTACFLVNHLLKNNSKEFKEHFKIETVSDDLVENLNQIAINRGCILKKNEYDYERVYQVVINDFRKGCFGPVSLEKPPKL